MKEPNLEDRLTAWEDIFKEFQKATPSSPGWYGIIDFVVGSLVHERIDALKREMATRSPQGTTEGSVR
jgi:hypothetical protein